MRAYVPAYDLRVPKNLKETFALLGQGYRPMAGGTDLMVLFEAGKLEQKKWVSLWDLKELRGISVAREEVTLGALTTYGEVRSHPILQKEYPNLVEAARETGAVAIQNRGTLGGNIANASPAADSPPALLSYGAILELQGPEGSRRVSYEGFHTGYKATLLQPNEIIARIILPKGTAKRLHYFRKVGTRKAQAISKVCFAASGYLEKKKTFRGLKIALGSVSPTVVRVSEVEKLLSGRILNSEILGEACRVLQKNISPIDDIRSEEIYRRTVANNLLCDFVMRFTGVGLDSKA